MSECKHVWMVNMQGISLLECRKCNIGIVNAYDQLKDVAKRLIDESERILLMNQNEGIELPRLKVAIENLQSVLGEENE